MAGFFACFSGPLPLGLLALASGWRQRARAWWWLMAAIVLAYALGIVWFTREVNLPLNQLTESWTPATLLADWSAVRDAWNRANLLRLLATAPAPAPATAIAGILRRAAATIRPMTTPTPLLVFAGSARAQSFNRQLASAAADIGRGAGAAVTHIELADFDVPLYNADLEARGTPRDVVRLKEIFFAHPAWLVVSPEYNGSYTALLKNTIDWVSSPIKGDPNWSSGSKPFAGKVAGLLAASPGALGGVRGLAHLAPLLMNLQCWISPKQFALSRAGEAFAADGTLVNDPACTSVRTVVEQVLWAARRFQG